MEIENASEKEKEDKKKAGGKHSGERGKGIEEERQERSYVENSY